MRIRVVLLTSFLTILFALNKETFLVHANITPETQSLPPTPGEQKSVDEPMAPDDDPSWPTLAANPARTSWTAAEVRGGLKPLWFHHFEPYISQKIQIIAVDNTLYLSTSDGLYALDADTGAEKWVYPTDLPLGHSPTVYDGVVYVGGFDHKIHAIRASDGVGLWTFAGGKGFHTNPLVIDVNGQTTIFAGNRDGYFYAIEDHGTSASLAWPPYKTNGPILYSAAYQDNTIYFASNDMHAYALNAQTGSLVWKSAKLPSYGFHSWWPVIYRDYVVFNGGWNYRFVRPFSEAGNHNLIEREEVYPANAQSGDPIGPYGTEPGDWAPGTTTINAYRITNYFEDKPWRRTYFMLNRNNGQEYTFDYDNDGRLEYAPFLYYGAKGGTRYPPAVGPDDVIYQANNYQYEGWIPRGQVTGWKIGTPFISIPAPNTNAVDEPLAFSIGGNIIYTRLCCDREAKAFDLVTGQSWGYWDQGGNTLRRYLPDLFSKGWPYGYWKHGDSSAPIPYNGKVYIIVNNAVVAFSPDGGDPVLPYDEDHGTDTGQSPDNIERGSTATGLNTKVTLNRTAWPLLIQQETYYSINHNADARARYFPLLEVAGSTSSPNSISQQNTNLTTIFTSSFAGGNTLTTRISKRTPTILFQNTSNTYYLNGRLAGIAYPTTSGINVTTHNTTINGSQLSEGWVMVWDNTSSHRWSPVIISLQNRPSQIVFNSSGLDITYSGSSGYLAVTPLYGMSAPTSAEETSWPHGIPQDTVSRIQLLNQVAHAFPNDHNETWSINNSNGDVSLTYTYSYIEYSDDWGTQAQQIAYVPPRAALAAWNNSPIRINGQALEQHLDLDYLTPIGRVAGVPNTNSVTVMLPGLANYWREIPEVSSPASPSDPALIELSAQIQAMLDAGHLRPGYGSSGIWDSMASNRIGSSLADLWHNPADTTYTLLRALPLLPPPMQQDVRQYLQQEFQTYPLHSIKHVGWANGAAREYFDLPPETNSELNNFPACSDSCSIGHHGWSLPPQNFYAMSMYAQEFGNASSLFANSQDKLDTTIHFQQSLPYFLNSYLQGHIGYLRLANLAGNGWQQNVEKTLIELFILKAATMKYPSALAETGFEYSGHMWSMRTYAPNYPDTLFNVKTIGTLWSQMPLYGFKRDPKYGLSGAGQGGAYTYGIDFVELVPEVSHFLHDYTLAEAEAAINDYETRAPYWFVARAEEMAGEGVLRPLYDTVALFQAKTQILEEKREDVEKYIDVPGYAVGDLFYIQNLTTILQNYVPSFTLEVIPSAQIIHPGDVATYSIQIEPTNGFTQTVTVTATGISPDVAADLWPVTITPPGTTTLTLTDLHTEPSLMPGEWYVIPITATGGDITKTTNAILLVGGSRSYMPVIFR